MKAEASKEQLLQKVLLVEKASGKHLTLPVLQGIHIEATQNSLILRATNLDIGIEATLPAKIEQPGVVVVPGTVFAQVLNALPGGGMVQFELIEGHLVVGGVGSTTRIKCLEHDDFPKLPVVSDGVSITVAAKDMVSGIKSVWYSASTSTIKPELASVYVFEQNGSIVFVATDSFRLAEKRIRPKKAIDFESFLIPIRNTVDMVRVLESNEGEVELRFNDNQLSAVFDGVYFTSRLIDGSFPDYQQIIPKEFPTEAIFLKQDVQGTLKKTTIFSDKFNQVSFKIEPHKKKVMVNASSAEVGEMNDTVPATIEGDDLEISFNQKYLAESFQSIISDSVSFSFGGVGRPMVMKGVSDDSFFYLVMPMNK